jgi:hypothetical protein
MHGKCPNCQQLITYVTMDPIQAQMGSRAWQVVVSVGIDPVAIGADLTDMIGRRIAEILGR